MNEVRFEILGDKRLLAALERMRGNKQAEKVLRQSLRASAKDMKSEVASKTPRSVSRSREGKHLASAYKVKALKRRAGRYGYRVMLPERDKIGVGQNEKWYYPTILEYGCRRRDGYVQPPIMMLHSAAENNVEQRAAAVSDSFFAAIEKEWLKP